MSEKDLKARVAAARAEGYTDAEIAEYLVAQGEISIAEAVKEGYTETQILDFLTTGVDPQRRLTTEPPPPPRQPGFGPGPFGGRALDTTLDVINETLLGGVEGAYNLGAMVTDPIASLFATPEQMEAARRQRRNFFAEASRNLATQERPIAREIGKVIAPATGVSRVATMAAPLVRTAVTRAGAPRAAQSLERVTRAAGTGGLGSGRTAAQTAALPRGQRALQLGERMVGGGLGGGATAALMGQDLEGVGEATAFGAGLPVVASVLKRVAGFTGDITKLPRQKAAEIIRKSLGENLEEARAAFAALSPDDRRLAEPVLLDVKIEPDTFYGLGKIAQEQLQPPGVNPMRVALEEDAAAREARLAEAAGGPNMESIRAAEREGRQAVTEAMKPIREAMYGRAGVASRVVPGLQTQAAAARQQADAITESRIVPRMRGLEGRTLEQIGDVFAHPELYAPGTAGRQLPRLGEIADQAGQRADDAIAAQLGLREGARDLEDIVDDLAAQGMQPMRAADLIGSLRQKMRDPEILAGSLEERVIKNVIRQIEKGTDANGMLNPRTLGKIRRSGLNEIVQTLSTKMTGGPSRTGTPEAAQATVTGLRDMIDDTLRSGGAGDLVDQFIQGSERGYAAVNRQRLAGEALRLYKQDPKAATEFQALVFGDRPAVVSKFMKGGPEKETIAGAFADDPARLAALRESAREMHILNRMGELRTAGAGPAGALLREHRPSRARALAAATLSTVPSLRIGASGAEETVKNIMLPRVQRQVGEAFTSGQAMNRMLNTFPGAARISEQVSRLPAEVRNLIAQQLIQQAVGPAPTLPAVDLPSGGRPFSNIDYDEYGNYIGPR
jgi:hypothetical protein